MKVIGYCRVSTGKQIKGPSNENQEERIRAWAKLNGADNVQIFKEKKGKSGKKTTNRAAFRAALEAVGKGDSLVSYSLSRFARSVPDAYKTLELLQKRGANMVSLSESIDTTTAMGRGFFGFLTVMAQLERELTGERVADMWASKRARGERLGGSYTAFGYKAEGKKLVRDPREQGAMRRVRNWRRDGASLRMIARKLEAHGIQRKDGGQTWHHTTVSRLVTRMEMV